MLKLNAFNTFIHRFFSCNKLMIILLTFAALNIKAENISLASRETQSNLTVGENLRDFDILPDGTLFAFWEDITNYKKTVHVAQKHPRASDNNKGTSDRPLKTINAAARLVKPGEKVIVHAGVYRECIQPVRGGTAPDNMIAYEAVAGEKVIIKGSEVWKPQLVSSSGWRLGPGANDLKILMADIPEDLFDWFNPFLARNVYQRLTNHYRTASAEWMQRAILFRGSVFINGKPMKQVFDISELARNEYSFWVEDPGGFRIHLSFPKDDDPSKYFFEISAREQIFAPSEFGLEYIRVSGFIFEHAANGIPVPQRGAVSVSRGHNWIIENNRIEWVNAVGIDLGAQTWYSDTREIMGEGHIVRNNIIRNIGICGLAGLYINNTLIENNLIEYVGFLNLESCEETAGMKFHGPFNMLVRNNILRHITHASAIWLDLRSTNCRITNNVMTDIQTRLGCLFMEINHERNIIDHNVFWNIRNDDPRANVTAPTNWSFGNGSALRVDCNDNLIIAHNFFGKVQEYAISLNTFQHHRIIDGRTGIGLANKVVNNIFYDCPNRIYLSKKLDNFIDGNLYDIRNERGPFMLVYPEPYTLQNLFGWQKLFGFDSNSTEVEIEAHFDSGTCSLSIFIEGEISECQMLSTIMDGKLTFPFPGPFSELNIQKSHKTYKIDQKFPYELR
jgi:hypothetical protein